MSQEINQNVEPTFIFEIPDDELLANTISVQGEKGERGDPTKTSQLTNDSDFTTNAALNAGLATKADLTAYQATAAQVATNTDAIAAIKNSVIRFSTNTASDTYYYPLALFPDISAGSVANASVNIHGRIGGSGTLTGEHIDISIIGYNAAIKAFGDYFTNNMPSDRRIDFAMYNDNGTYTLYIKTYKYTAVDLDVDFLHCTKIFDASSAATTTPSGDLVWAFSQDSNVQVNYNGTINADISGDAATVNGHTVESDVPASAVFTDTVYDDTEVQNALANKADSLYVSDTYATKSLLESNVADLTSQISSLASGSPISASSTSEMTDTSKVYVNTTDGYWYYYNGSTWVSGGVYQEAVTDTNAMQETVNDLVFDRIGLTSLKWKRGGVDASTHALTNATDRIRNMTAVYAKKGSFLTLTDTTNYRWKISKFADIQKNNLKYIGGVGTQESLSTEATKVLDEDCYIVINIATKNGATIPDSEDTFNQIVSLVTGKLYYRENNEEQHDVELYDPTEVTTGAYWGSGDGSFNIGTSGSGFSAASRAFTVKAGSLIKVINKGNRTGKNVGVFLDKNLSRVTGWNVDGVYSRVVPDNAKYLCVSLFESNINDYSITITDIDTKTEENNYRLIYDDPKIKLIAHRGLNDFAPEATIPAYTLAGEAGMWGLKIDICETLDGYFVCSHDDSVDRMFDGTGYIRDLTLADIQNMTVDSGSNISQYPNQKIVQLYEALEICKRYNMHPFIEFKRLLSNSSVARVVEIVRSYGLLENTLCQCSDGIKEYLYALREVTDIIPISYWLGTMAKDTNMPRVRFLGNAWLSLNAFSGSETSQFEAYARTFRDEHLPLLAAAMTINQLSYVKKWIKEYGLDMVVTSGITYADLAE